MLLHLSTKKAFAYLVQMRLANLLSPAVVKVGRWAPPGALRWLECIGTPKTNYFVLWCEFYISVMTSQLQPQLHCARLSAPASGRPWVRSLKLAPP